MSYVLYYQDDIIEKSINEKWKGDGILDNPFIIESPHSFSEHSVIKDTLLHIIFKNCSFKYLTLNRCKNFKFDHCTFEVLYLSKCSETIIENCFFNLKLDLTKSHKIQIFDSSLPFLELFKSYENHFKKCTINQIRNQFSRASTFETINTPIKEFEIILNKSPLKYYFKFLPYPIAGIILLLLSIVRLSNNIAPLLIWSMVGGIFLLTSFILLIFVVVLINYKKMKNYPLNKVF